MSYVLSKEAEIARLRAEVERLRAALQPLADIARHYSPYSETMNDRTVECVLTLGSLRAALGAIEQKAPEPSFEDILGMAPDATGGMSSEDFVRKLRDEWDR